MPCDFFLLRFSGRADPIPTLVVDLGVPHQMPAMRRFIDLLVGIGWVPLSARPTVSVLDTAQIVATVNLTAASVLLQTGIGADDGVLAEDVDGPLVPSANWWEAVRRAGDTCLVVLVDVIDLHRPRRVLRALRRGFGQGPVFVGAATVTRDSLARGGARSLPPDTGPLPFLSEEVAVN